MRDREGSRKASQAVTAACALLLLVAGPLAFGSESAPDIPWGGTRGTTHPILRTRAYGVYPKGLEKAKIGASLILQVVVRRDGSVEVVELLGCRAWKWRKPPDERYAAYCEEVFREAGKTVERWKYAPALLEGRPIDSFLALTFEFYKRAGKRPVDIWTEDELNAMIPEGAKLDGGEEPPAPPPERPAAALPRNEPWLELRTKNFTVYTNGSENSARQAAQRLETLREVLRQRHGRDTVRSPRPTLVYLFRDSITFAPYTIGADVGGYFFESYDGNFIALHARLGFSGTIFHEYLHYFLRNNLPNVPLWLNEGMAELYSSFSVRDRRARIGQVQRHHLDELRAEDLMSLQELFEVQHDSEVYNESERRGLFYAQSWALVHFLVLGEQDLMPNLTDFLERSGRREKPAAAFEAAFEMSDEALIEQLEEYLRADSFPVMDYQFEELDVSLAAESRAMSRAESLVHLGNLLMHADSEKLDGPAEHFRAALEAEPELAIAHRGMGMLHEAAGEREAALVSLTKAAQLDPDDELVYLARADVLLTAAEEEFENTGSSTAEHLPEIEYLLERVVELNPRRADAYRLLGEALLLANSCDEGPPALKKAWQMMPSDMTTAANLAMLLGACGETENANYIVENFLKPYATREHAALVGRVVLDGEIRIAIGLAAEDREAEAVERLEEILERTDDPEQQNQIEAALEHLGRSSRTDSLFDRFNQAVQKSRRGEQEAALHDARDVLAEFDALELGKAAGLADARSQVVGFIDATFVQLQIERAMLLLRRGSLQEGLALLDSAEQDIERFLARATTPGTKMSLRDSQSRAEQARAIGWTTHYRNAVLTASDNRSKAMELIREIIETCPYPDTVASARKSLAELER